jgi:hypothetical protein
VDNLNETKADILKGNSNLIIDNIVTWQLKDRNSEARRDGRY